jgi:AcrR family transcriptional regulator
MSEIHEMPVSRSPRDRGPETERRLLDATLECLRTHGIGGTTSRQITSTAGVNLAAITYHFGSKDELVAQALAQATRRWLAPVLEVLSRDQDPAVRMIAAVSAFRTAFEDAREILPAYFQALVQAPRSSAVQAVMSETVDEFRAILTRQTTEMRTAGYLPSWVVPEAMATVLIAILDGLALQAIINPQALNPDVVLGQVVNLLMAVRTGQS